MQGPPKSFPVVPCADHALPSLQPRGEEEWFPDERGRERRERRAIGAWRLQQTRSEHLAISSKPLPLLEEARRLLHPERLRKAARPRNHSAAAVAAVVVVG